MKRVLLIFSLLILVIMPFSTGCGGPKIKVGTGDAPERLLLAQMIIAILSEHGFEVIDMTPTGSKSQTHEALEKGTIDIYPDYTGNYYEQDKNNPDIVWLKPAPADNKWAIAISRSLAIAETIWDMEQLKAYLFPENAPQPRFKLMCSYEFTTDPNALPLFKNKYGLDLTPDQLRIIPNANTLYGGIEAAKNQDINAAMAYTTDGYLDEYDLVILKDNKEPIPEFHPACLINVNSKAYERYAEELNRILTPLFASLTNETLKELNSQIGLVGKDVISEVARKYVQEHCYFKYDELHMVQSAMDEMMAAAGLQNGSVPSHGKTSDMSSFPSDDYPLFWDKDNRPAYAKSDWPPFTLSETRGTYSCDSNGRVTQHSTGW